jgi:hypothetical protein
LIDVESDENNDDNASADDQEEEELLLCPSCGDTPCIWNELGPEVIAVRINHAWLDAWLEIDNQLHDFDVHVFESMDDQQLAEIHLEHKHHCHASYTSFNKAWAEGGRGRGNRKRVPKCCEEKIHLMYPVPPGYERTGFRLLSE